MRKFAVFLLIALFLTSCTYTYYIVRHAEKAVFYAGVIINTPEDPPLSDAS